MVYGHTPAHFEHWWQVNDDYEQTRENIHAFSRIRTHGLNVQAIKACASDRAANGPAG
jgi:hypothetical protein